MTIVLLSHNDIIAQKDRFNLLCNYIDSNIFRLGTPQELTIANIVAEDVGVWLSNTNVATSPWKFVGGGLTSTICT